MTLLLAFTVLAEGDASFYAPDLMEQVYANRLGWGHVQPCAECIGAVALMSCDELGRLVWLGWPDGSVDGPYLVVDCAQSAHRAGLVARGRVVEVDYATAMRHQMNGPVPVRVLAPVPEAVCPTRGAC